MTQQIASQKVSQILFPLNGFRRDEGIRFPFLQKNEFNEILELFYNSQIETKLKLIYLEIDQLKKENAYLKEQLEEIKKNIILVF